MPAHYETIKDQLKADIVAVLVQIPGSAPIVKFGQPTKPIKTYPQSVVRSVVDRVNEGRSVDEFYSFEIEMKLPPHDPASTDRESYIYLWADKLVMLLAPFDTEEVPDPADFYAGVGSSRHVSKVTPGEETDADPFCSVKVLFETAATIYQ